MNRIFEIAANISTPLALAGFFAAVFFFIVRQIIKRNIFPKLTAHLGADIIKLILLYLFVLSLVAMVLGFAGFIIVRLVPPAKSASVVCPLLKGARAISDQEGRYTISLEWENVNLFGGTLYW